MMGLDSDKKVFQHVSLEFKWTWFWRNESWSTKQHQRRSDFRATGRREPSAAASSSSWSRSSVSRCAHGIPTERIPIGIPSVGIRSGHHHHHHHHHCQFHFSKFFIIFHDGQSQPDPSWCKEKLQLQSVRLLYYQTFQFENPYASSQWRETVCLFTMQLLLQSSWQA